MDHSDWRIVDMLQTDGRTPLKALAQAAQLSVAATAERVRKLQDQQVIQGVRAQLDPARLGYTVKAIIGITVEQPRKKLFIDALRRAPEVLECHHVAGADSYLIQVIAEDLPRLEQFLATINPFGETRTSIVFSTPIERQPIVPPGSLRSVD